MNNNNKEGEKGKMMHQSNDNMIMYFKTLAELDGWWAEEQGRNLQEFPPPNYPLFLHADDDSRVDEHRQQPRLIICHDMMGGYVEDVQEHENEHSNPNGLFHLSKWSCIDTFIYFAHHRISLPPPSWIKIWQVRANTFAHTLKVEIFV